MALATFGAGCFWCSEATFAKLRGIKNIVSGYAGGSTNDPTYEQICKGASGHAEVIQIEYDTAELSYDQLLEVFFHVHDPTTLNRQGNDTGTQYRSVIFFGTEEEKIIANNKIMDIDDRKLYPNPIVTEVVALNTFYPAEEYHQQFFARNPNQGYCLATIPPKLKKLEKIFPELLR